MLTTYQQQARTKLVLTIVSIVVIAGVVLLVDHLKADTAMNTAQTQQSTTTDPPAVTKRTSTSEAKYADGIYTATSEYAVPSGGESITVTATLSGGAVTNVSVQHSEHDRESAEFQEDFSSLYKSQVVGKPISSINVSDVAGASDTAQAFNDALDQIESKALS